MTEARCIVYMRGVKKATKGSVFPGGGRLSFFCTDAARPALAGTAEGGEVPDEAEGEAGTTPRGTRGSE